MPGLEVALGTLPLPIWAVGAAAALLLVGAIVAVRYAGARGLGRLLGRATLVLVAVAGAWIYVEHSTMREQAAARRALDQRMNQLAAHAIAPGSALACLDAMAGDTVEAACEKALFASPEAIAAAVSYVAARMTLLADAAAHARSDPGYETVFGPMRLALETDRFGIVAHVLAMRDSCTALQCDSLDLFRDPGRVQANLKERTFDHHITRHAAEWPARGAPATGVAGEKDGSPALASTGSVAAPGGVALSPRYDFPSAASIPPVSIMDPEPGQRSAPAAPAGSGTATAPKPAAAPVPPRRPAAAPRSQAATAAPSAPVQLLPPGAPPGGSAAR